MAATYLVRFDDICPTMNWEVWNRIEPVLLELDIRPIMAVVPDNQDPELEVAPAIADFWNKVRRWKERGWTIGLHGLNHRYVTRRAGVLGRNNYSEFAGLPGAEQEEKLARAMAIMAGEGVVPDIWVAPAHSYDAATLLALQRLNLTCVSDGYSLFPFSDASGMVWIPQQFGRFRYAPVGVWTVCLHVNRWTANEVARFQCDAKSYKDNIQSMQAVVQRYQGRRAEWCDALVRSALGSRANVKRILRRYKAFDQN